MSTISPNGCKVYTRQTADGVVHSTIKKGKAIKNVYQNNDGTTRVVDLKNGTETNVVKTETEERKEYDSVTRSSVTGDVIRAYNRVYVKDSGDVVERVENKDGVKAYLNGQELAVVDDDNLHILAAGKQGIHAVPEIILGIKTRDRKTDEFHSISLSAASKAWAMT
jgi:hypothetical protein